MLMNEAAAEAMALAGTVYVPTVSGPRRVASRGVEHGISSDIAARAAALLPAHQAALRHALEKGVRIANGSDCCGLPVYPFGDNVEELSTLVELGMSTRQALRAATSEAAAALGLGGAIGVLRKGARADIIGMAGDPVTDIAALRDVRLVIKSGIPFVDRLAANS
jgi:imidazolonepropionase-like amidohydrolase